MPFAARNDSQPSIGSSRSSAKWLSGIRLQQPQNGCASVLSCCSIGFPLLIVRLLSGVGNVRGPLQLLTLEPLEAAAVAAEFLTVVDEALL
jgi:hypothetical protein